MYLLLLTFFFATQLFSQPSYDIGDWTSYRDFRYGVSVDAGTREVYIATTGGILSYNIIKKSWYDPMVVGYGFSEPVPIDEPVLLLLDEDNNFLWVATRRELLQYNLNSGEWRKVENNLWGTMDRVVNIGVGGNSIWIETIPGDVYKGLFNSGTPIPSPIWEKSVTLYKGTRNFGGFQLELNPVEEPNIRWRGLRSKQFPENDQFPSLVLPPGYIFKANGTIIDPELHEFPATDWIVDQWHNLWLTSWGAGILKADLRIYNAELYQAGPAGNNLEAFLDDGKNYWMGGKNMSERLGFSRVSRDLVNDWQMFTTRDNIRIPSTLVKDFASFDDCVYIATNEGLLEYNEQKSKWEAYTVSKNLQNDEIRALASADTELWIGTAKGVCVMTKPSHEIWRVPNEGIDLTGVVSMAIAQDTVFVGTVNGWFKGATKDRAFVYTDLDPGFYAGEVYEISASGSEVWAITKQGLMVYNENTGDSKSWLANVWLGNHQPTCVDAMQDFVWVGTDNGFYRYNKKTKQWVQFTTKDGLLDNHIQRIRHDGDDLLICTPSGLTRFYWNSPKRIK